MQQAITLTQPAPGKSCGGCTLCCKVLKITTLNKPHGTWCSHCQPGVGCRVYDDRPEECRTFLCGWLVNSQLGPQWKPDKSRLIVTNAADGNGLAIRCDPGYPNAWRKEPYHSQILQWAKAAKTQDGPIVVAVGNRLTVIAPEGEFPLASSAKAIRFFANSRVADLWVCGLSGPANNVRKNIPLGILHVMARPDQGEAVRTSA
jgi:hypothetical protein